MTISINWDLRFVFLRMGYVRFPYEYWVDNLSRIEMPGPLTLGERRSLVTEFFATFAATHTKRKDINLGVLRPFPFFFQAPSGEYYFDLRGVGDFLRDLIEKAKEWFSSQHGDRFTLSLKTKIEQELKSVIVLGKKVKVRNANGGETECDLLISAGKTLYVVECKAHAKSPEFFRGSPKAVQQRSSLLKEDYQQAERAADAVQFEISQANSILPPHPAGVEFCVCTPSQEFIQPINRFGWLADRVPKICTPEELITVFKNAI